MTEIKNSPDTVVIQLRARLTEQIAELEDYLTILSRQEQAIQNGNVEDIAACIQYGRGLSNKMADIQKVISPLQQLYVEVCPEQNQSVEALQCSLQTLQNKALTHSQCLIERMQREASLLQQEIAQLPSFRNEIFLAEESALHVDMSA